jgi:predicted HicB family RNase H-like nuclease
MLIRLPAELKQRAKAAAALAGKSLQDWVAELIREKLRENGAKVSRKKQ